MSRLKKILIGLAVLAVAVVVAIVAILLSVDYNQYKSVATAEVEAATGRKFEIAGDLSLSLRLSPRIVLNDVTLANADWGTRPEMLKIKRLEVEVELLPLLSGEVWVKRLIVKGADILLERNPDGAANWVFGSATSPEPGGSGAPALPMINDVSIQDSQLRYRDGQTGAEHSLFIESLLGSASGFDEPVTLAVAARIGENPLRFDGRLGPLATLFADASYPVDAKLEAVDTTATVKGTIEHPLGGTGLALAIAVDGKNLADLGPLFNGTLPTVGPYSLTGNLTDPAATYRLDPFQLTVGSSALSGTAAIALDGERPKITASVAGAVVDLKDFGVTPNTEQGATADDGRVFPADLLPLGWLHTIDAAVELSVERLIKAPVTLQNLKTTIALDAAKLTVANLESGIGAGSFTLSGVVDAAQNPAALDAAVQARKVEVGNLLETLEISDVLGGGSGDLDLKISGHGNSVRELMGGVDGTTNFTMAGGHINNGFARLMLSDLFSLVNIGGGSSSEINCLVARFDIEAGQATSRGLVMDTSGATIFGSGKVNLATEGLALRFDPHAKATNLVNLAIPVQVGGTIANPDVVPDPTAVPGKVVGAVADTANGVFDLLGKVTGTGGSDGGEANPCATALDTASGSKPDSSGGTLIDSVGGAVEDTVKGVGDAINDLFQ